MCKLVIPRTVDKISKYWSLIEIDKQYTFPLLILKIGGELLITRFVTVAFKYLFAKTSISKLTVEGTKYKEPISRTRVGDDDEKIIKIL